jgi:hypothetical protein
MDDVLRDRMMGYLNDEIEKSKHHTATLRRRKRFLEREGPFTYVIDLESNWSTEGEKSHSFRFTGDLKELIPKAEAEYKRLNTRSDVQATYRVYIILDKDNTSTIRVPPVPVPERFWRNYTERERKLHAS